MRSVRPSHLIEVGVPTLHRSRSRLSGGAGIPRGSAFRWLSEEPSAEPSGLCTKGKHGRDSSRPRGKRSVTSGLSTCAGAKPTAPLSTSVVGSLPFLCRYSLRALLMRARSRAARSDRATGRVSSATSFCMALRTQNEAYAQNSVSNSELWRRAAKSNHATPSWRSSRRSTLLPWKPQARRAIAGRKALVSLRRAAAASPHPAATTRSHSSRALSLC